MLTDYIHDKIKIYYKSKTFDLDKLKKKVINEFLNLLSKLVEVTTYKKINKPKLLLLFTA